MAPTVVVRILGGLELEVDGEPRPLAGMRQRAVLALLVLHRGQALSMDRIADELWGDRPPATARKTIQVYVSQLRRTLGEASSLLATAEGGYVLSAGVETDADEFERRASAGRDLAAHGRPQDASAAYADALALWRGDPLSDFAYEAFAREEITILSERRLVVVEQRIDADLACGRHRELVGELEALVARNPLREGLRGQLMVALYRSGRQADALEVFQAGRRTLADELGIDPGPDLVGLRDAILAHDPALDPPRARRSEDRSARWRRRQFALGGAILVVAAVAAAVVELSGGAGGTALAGGVPGDHVGAISPATNTLVADIAVGRTPTDVVVGAGRVWVLNADDRTISRIDPRGGPADTNGTGATPAGIAVGGGSVWISYGSTSLRGRIRIRRFDPATLRSEGQIALPGHGFAEGDQPLVYAGGALWAIDAGGTLDRIDPRTGRIHAAARNVGGPIAAGLGAVWAATGGPGGTTAVVRVDTGTGAVRVLPTPVLQLEGLAVGAGAVWATDASTGSLWRIRPTHPPIPQSVQVGLGAGPVTVGGGGVWVASGIDGTVSRVSSDARHVVRTIPTGNTPQGIVYGAGRVWVSVAVGGGGAIGNTAVTAPRGVIPSLPQAICGPVFYAGPGRPDALIASDLPFEDQGSQTRPMVEAIKFVLREHHFRAGRFRIGYQSCDDATVAAGTWTRGKCDANARAYAATPSLLGVIGTYNSGCAVEEVPITNRAGLALISPSNSYRGLTQAGPAVLPGQPASLYPTGRRTYVRVFPADGVQAQAQVRLARGLRLDRLFVVHDTEVGGYGTVLAAGVVQAARGSGVTVAGDVHWSASNAGNAAAARAADLRAASALALRIRASGATAVDLCGAPDSFGASVIDRLRRLLGPRIPFIAGDAFLFAPGLARARPFYVTNAAITDPGRQLPATGRAFLSAFRGTQPVRSEGFFAVYAAESAEVLLQAIKGSDGRRPSVVQHLLGAHVHGGILGSFAFTGSGDITVDRVGVYTVSAQDAFVFDHNIVLHYPAGG